MGRVAAPNANLNRQLQESGRGLLEQRETDRTQRDLLQGDIDHINEGRMRSGQALMANAPTQASISFRQLSGTPIKHRPSDGAPRSTPSSEIRDSIAANSPPSDNASPGTGDFDYDAAMQQWESIFGDDNKKAYATGQTALQGQLSANTRRQQEMSAMSGRSTMGGGYQAGAAQAALSGGTSAANFETNFYQTQQRQKQGFLEKQLSIAQRNGELDKANQIQIAMAKLGLLSDIGNTEADTEFLNGTEK